jgi:hypothetical protein
MTTKEQLEEELAIFTLVDEYEALRPKVEDKASQTTEDMARYRELNDQIAAARTAFKEKYGPTPVEEGDAVATPDTVVAKTS